MSQQTVRNIWGIGRNYSEHAKELNNEIPKEPVVFLKAGSTLQPDKKELVFPHWLKDPHYEVEIVLQYGDNLDFKNAYLGIDFTDRNQQLDLQKKSLPWTLAKSFPGASCISPALSAESLEQLENLEFNLKINGEERQNSSAASMIFNVNTLFKYIKETYPVCPNDLIFTGTPKGVGPIKNGDTIEVSSSMGGEHSWTVHQPNLRGE